MANSSEPADMIFVMPFASKNTEGVFDLILSIQQQEFGIPITRGDQPDLAAIPSYYQCGKGNFWVALNKGLVVGTIALLDIGNGEAALRKLFVAPGYRGAGPGVAKDLLATLLDWSLAQSVQRIYLGTTVSFLAAHRFYEKNGFQEISASELPSSFPVMKVDTKFYFRRP